MAGHDGMLLKSGILEPEAGELQVEVQPGLQKETLTHK